MTPITTRTGLLGGQIGPGIGKGDYDTHMATLGSVVHVHRGLKDPHDGQPLSNDHRCPPDIYLIGHTVLSPGARWTRAKVYSNRPACE